MDRPSGPRRQPGGSPFSWRADTVMASAGPHYWTIWRKARELTGPEFRRGETWSDTVNRLRERLDTNEPP